MIKLTGDICLAWRNSWLNPIISDNKLMIKKFCFNFIIFVLISWSYRHRRVWKVFHNAELHENGAEGDVRLRAVDGAWAGNPHLRRSEIEFRPFLQRAIRDSLAPRSPAPGRRLRRARLQCHRRPLLPQQWVDRLWRYLRHRPHLGHPQWIRSQKRVPSALRPYRWSPVVPRWNAYRCLRWWKGQIVRTRLHVSEFVFHLIIMEWTLYFGNPFKYSPKRLNLQS